MKIAIYLAGSIKKGHEKSDDTYWTEDDMSQIRETLSDYDIAFLNPAFRTDDLSDSRSVFGRDMLQVYSSDAVFVDARDRRGLGVGAEMMWAKVNHIPVVTWAPRNSHYRKDHATLLGVPIDHFVHPFVEALSDHLVENPTEGAFWIDSLMRNPQNKIKGLSSIGSAMEYYKESQFEKDLPMKELFSCMQLQKRMPRTHPRALV